MQDLLRRYGSGLTGAFILLTAFWLVVLIILPNLYLFENSFRPYLPVAEVGGPKDVYSLDNYAKIFNGESALEVLGMSIPIPVHIKSFVLTVWYSAVVTVISFAIAYPLAYYLAKIVSPKSLATLFLLLFVPLWVSEVLRSFAWFIILSLNGPLNFVLTGLGITEEKIRWISGYRSILIGLVYTYVLFMLFPIYNAIQSLDTNQIEAAEDLGSPWWRTHWRVIIPHAKPGIASGCVMVFMLSAGSLLVPTVVGSTKANWFPQTIYTWFNDALDWNTGAAYSMI
ncbi:MAG: hypothetical protein RIR62_1983, partial [Pseudomonadota bacterium]